MITLIISSGVLEVDDFPVWSSLQSVSAGSSGSPGSIARSAAWTIVMVNSGPRVQLSSGFQIGDYVEIYSDIASMGTNAVQVSTASEAIIQAGNGSYAYAVSLPKVLRKVSSFEWATQT